MESNTTGTEDAPFFALSGWQVAVTSGRSSNGQTPLSRLLTGRWRATFKARPAEPVYRETQPGVCRP